MPKFLVALAVVGIGLLIWFVLLPELQKADLPDNRPQLPRRTFEMPDPFEQ